MLIDTDLEFNRHSRFAARPPSRSASLTPNSARSASARQAQTERMQKERPHRIATRPFTGTKACLCRRVEPLDDLGGQIEPRLGSDDAGVADAEDDQQALVRAHLLDDGVELFLKI